jgi:hypothetical protein
MRLVVSCAAALAVVVACAREIRPPPADSLNGFTAPLSYLSGLRMVVDGSVDDAPADVILDIASPLSAISAACLLDGREIHAERTARVRQVDGTVLDMPEVALPPARIGTRRIGARMVGVVPARDRCVLSLGGDVLSQYAIHLDPERHSLSLSETVPRQRYLERPPSSSTEDVQLIELTRHPDTDWPLVSARLSRGSAQMTSTFILSSRSARSTLSNDEARAGGFQPLAARFPIDDFELSPGFGIQHLTLRSDSTWKNAVAVGLLGSDVWGRFRSTIDLRGGVLILRRPKTSSASGRQLCASADGQNSEEACFALRTVKRGDSLSVVGTVWRDLPEGGRLHLDPVDSQGHPVLTGCQYGLSFPAGARGSSMRRDFPWGNVAQAFPECAEAVRGANGFSLSLFEEGPLDECEGECAFVRRRSGRRVLCACASSFGDF